MAARKISLLSKSLTLRSRHVALPQSLWPCTLSRLSLTQERTSAAGRDWSRNVPSNHLSTAQKLQPRVQYERLPREKPPEFKKVWADLKKLLDGNEVLSAKKALEKLKKPLIATYSNEIDFSRDLFEAMRSFLSGCDEQEDKDGCDEQKNKDGFDEQEDKDNDIIILKVGKTQEYAVGLAHQNAVASDLRAEIGESEPSFLSTSSDMEKTKPDHGVCLFQKANNGKWRVKDCFSVVELKLSDTSCHDFNLLKDGTIRNASLDDEHGALGQAILYNLGCVLPFHARRGVLREGLPLAMIAGKRTSTWTKQLKVPGHNKGQRLRWMSGNLEIPKTCGGVFYYGVKDFGYFHDELDAMDNESVENALSVYLNTILFGLSLAMRVHKNFTDNAIPPAVPASGLCLAIGGVPLMLPFCASPIPGANRLRAPAEGEGWRISQGDLFAGKLDVSKKYWKSENAYVDFVDVRSREVDVVVKVSSPAVHRLLVHPDLSFAALKSVGAAKSKLASEVGSVLFAAIETKNGLVTIMADLSKQGYRTLEPKEESDKLSVLWAGFSVLVESMLLPMAKIGIIHPDIRPGFDVTSNVLCKLDAASENASIKLIDYESLVDVNKWQAPVQDGRYIFKHEMWNATAFVWWQCMCLGYAWHNELDASVLRYGAHFDDLCIDFYGTRSMDWWKEFDYSADDIMEEQCVLDTLVKLGKLFGR